MRNIVCAIMAAACMLASCTSIPEGEVARAKARGVPVLFESLEAYAADSGAGCMVKFVVTSDRPIEYVWTWCTPIRSDGEPEPGRCLDCGGGLPHPEMLAGPFAPGRITTIRSSARWTGPVECFRIDRCRVEFLDGERSEFAGESLGRVLASTLKRCP